MADHSVVFRFTEWVAAGNDVPIVFHCVWRGHCNYDYHHDGSIGSERRTIHICATFCEHGRAEVTFNVLLYAAFKQHLRDYNLGNTYFWCIATSVFG